MKAIIWVHWFRHPKVGANLGQGKWSECEVVNKREVRSALGPSSHLLAKQLCCTVL
jgi:hypothetical protein